MNILMESVFGSHLYGLATEHSDRDYKGIVLPNKRDILLGNSKYHIDSSTNTSQTRNSNEDIDKTYYSLAYFIELACKGETVALDLLHGNEDKLIQTSEEWKFLVKHKHRFFTKDMKSYIGYVRKQAAKYGIKGTRISELEKMLQFLSKNKNSVVGELDFPETEFGKWVDYKGNRYYEFAGSKYQDNLKVHYMYETLSKIYDTYGERAKQAKTNDGVDWKALLHGLRSAYQARDIYLHGGFEYPLKESKFLMDVKLGKKDFLTEVEPEFDRITKEVFKLAEESNYPSSVDRTFWYDFLETVHLKVVNFE